jgi:hypothetical protein
LSKSCFEQFWKITRHDCVTAQLINTTDYGSRALKRYRSGLQYKQQNLEMNLTINSRAKRQRRMKIIEETSFFCFSEFLHLILTNWLEVVSIDVIRVVRMR